MADASTQSVNPDSASTAVGTPVTIHVLNNDINVLGTFQPISLVVTTDPTNGTTIVNESDGTIVYTPNANFAGQDTFVYYVCDDEPVAFCGSGLVTVTVAATPVATDTPVPTLESWPITHPDAGATLVGAPITLNVLANDEAQTFPIVASTLTIATPPQNGTATANTTDGTVTYTPASGFTGTDTFVYQVCDSQATPHCSPGTVTVQVFAAATATPTVATPVATSTPAPATSTPPPATPVSTTTAGANAATTPLPPATGSGVRPGDGRAPGMLLLALVGICAVGAAGAFVGFSITSRSR